MKIRDFSSKKIGLTGYFFFAIFKKKPNRLIFWKSWRILEKKIWSHCSQIFQKYQKIFVNFKESQNILKLCFQTKTQQDKFNVGVLSILMFLSDLYFSAKIENSKFNQKQLWKSRKNAKKCEIIHLITPTGKGPPC